MRRTDGRTHDGEIDREKKPTVAAACLSLSPSQLSTIDASLREKGGQGMTHDSDAAVAGWLYAMHGLGISSSN